MAASPRERRARLERLAVRDFRNLAAVELALPADGAVVVGENGHGKSNLLEAIYYLELLRSARGARDQDLVRFGAEGFHLRGEIETDTGHSVSVGFVRQGKRKRVRIDDVEPERLSDALGALPAVMFAPGDVELVAGPPAARRRYLDVMLALASRRYLHALQRYRAALARRNAALRAAARPGGTSAGADQQVAVWEPVLAREGATLWALRLEWTEEHAAGFAERCRAIGEATAPSLRYVSAVAAAGDLERALTVALEEKRGLDLRRGITHAGPHRDDVALLLGGRDLRTFGSAGQQRTAAIALRMLEVSTLRRAREMAPIFLLDDPFAELDLRRADRIVGLLADTGLGQTVLAVPRVEDIPRGLPRLERLEIAEGELRPWGGAAA